MKIGTRVRASECSSRASVSRLCGSASKIGLAVAAALATAAPRAFALDADVTSGGMLEEVVVTARKRTENLQDVPLSIDVFTRKNLKNLAINSIDDYAQKVPSISFISTGPGTQLFVMRGVSDGSNPNYANSSSTGFFVDDLSMSSSGAQPDLHLYDIERIEVLNGPQGTTYGAGSMSGAIRYITNKPDVNAFSAGIDFDGGKIQRAQNNWTYEGFVNIPVIDGILGLRASAFSDSHGGFINNQLTTRTWVNGTVSNNAQWARNNYNREHVEGGRLALKAVMGDRWSALLTYGYQRQSTLGAWDEDPTLASRTVARFGPESHKFEAKMLDVHVEGDVGIGDLVFASTYWQQPSRQQNEYSQYIENHKGGLGEGLACQSDPVYGTGYAGCNVPLQFYEYHTNGEQWSNELRIVSKPGGRFHWLTGLYWEKYRDKDSGSTFFTPGLRTDGAQFLYYLNYYQTSASSLPPGETYAYRTRSDYLQTTEFANINFDVTDKLNVEAGVVHFHSDFSYYSPYAQFAYAPTSPGLSVGSSHKWNGKFGINYKLADHVLVYADFAQGFRDGGSNAGYSTGCYNRGVPHTYSPDTLNNYELGWKTTSLNGHLTWNGAAYFMDWKQLQTLIYNPAVCSSSSFNINVGDGRIYGVESNLNYQLNDHWSTQASADYTDSHLISTATPAFQAYVGERLAFAPYFSWSWNARYEQPLGGELRGYAQLDVAHKGDMWNGLNPEDKNLNLPRILQPAYTIVNLRFGLNPENEVWQAEFYVSNLADKNAIVYSNTGNFDLRLTTNEPRVFGLRLNYRWGKGS